MSKIRLNLIPVEFAKPYREELEKAFGQSIAYKAPVKTGAVAAQHKYLEVPLESSKSLHTYVERTVNPEELQLHGFKSYTDYVDFVLNLKSEFPNATREGFLHIFRGANLEHMVFNFSPLIAKCFETARSHVASLNEALATGAAHIINARGLVVTGLKKFGAIKKAINVSTVVGSTAYKFSDMLFVSKAVDAQGNTYWTFSVILEVKAPSSAKDFTKQIGEFLERISDPDLKHVVFEIDGEIVNVKPEDLLFNIKEINQVVVAPLRTTTFDKRVERMKEPYTLTPKDIFSKSNARIISSRHSDNATALRFDLLIDIGVIDRLVTQTMSSPALEFREK